MALKIDKKNKTVNTLIILNSGSIRKLTVFKHFISNQH